MTGAAQAGNPGSRMGLAEALCRLANETLSTLNKGPPLR